MNNLEAIPLWPATYMVVPELVDGCQMSCELCWNHDRRGSMENMSLETIRKIIEKHGHVLGCWYNWGEPTLHKNFVEVSNLIKQQAQSYISTNLSLSLSDEYLRALLNYTRVYVSVSGITKEVYDIYNKGGNFDQVFSNLDKLIQFKKDSNSSTFIILRFERHQFNEHQYDAVLNFCTDKGILFEPIHLSCEVEKNMKGFMHDLLRKPQFNDAQNSCALLGQFPIGIDGIYLLCCASRNVKLSYSVYDNITMEDLIEDRDNNTFCKNCREQGLFKAYY